MHSLSPRAWSNPGNSRDKRECKHICKSNVWEIGGKKSRSLWVASIGTFIAQYDVVSIYYRSQVPTFLKLSNVSWVAEKGFR